MHRTLKAECTRPPKGNLGAQQRRFNTWVEEYNIERPHDSLDGDFPAEHYRPTIREFPDVLPEVEYPEHFEVRRVSANHCFRWKNEAIYISSSLQHEHIGMEEVIDGVWAVYFSWKRIGFLDEKSMLILDEFGTRNGRKV